MILREAMLKAIGARGLEIGQLYLRLRHDSREQVEGVLAGLVRAGTVIRVGPLVSLRTIEPTVGRCAACGEAKTEQQLLESGVCLRCVSDQAIATEDAERETRRAGRRCSDCGQVKDGSAFYNNRNQCIACISKKNRNYEQERKPAAARRRGLTKHGVPSWEKVYQTMKTMDSAPLGRSSGHSSDRSASTR